MITPIPNDVIYEQKSRGGFRSSSPMILRSSLFLMRGRINLLGILVMEYLGNHHLDCKDSNDYDSNASKQPVDETENIEYVVQYFHNCIILSEIRI